MKEIKLTFSEWVKKQLTQKQVEERLKKLNKKKGSDFDADMDAQDPKWGKYKI